MKNNTLYVLTTLFNPSHYKRRNELHDEFISRMESTPGVEVRVAEIVQQGCEFERTDYDNPKHLQLLAQDTLWHKESAVNALFKTLPDDWEYAAVIDADIVFINPNWVSATIAALQRHDIVQMFEQCAYLNKHGRIAHIADSYMFKQCKLNGDKINTVYDLDLGAAHPGFAWAFTRNAYEVTGGYNDVSIVGSGDWVSLCGWLGVPDKSIPGGMKFSDGFMDNLYQYSDRCAALDKNIGVVDGLVMHYFHGSAKNRQYYERHFILVNTQYDPVVHTERDLNGMISLCNSAPYAAMLREG